jgi:hypothetical protein
MESLLAEQPLLLSLLLGVLAAGLLFGWLRTGQRAAAVAGLVVALLIPVVWLVASQWQTDREQIETLIYQIADAVERNDHEAAIAIIGDPQTQAHARMELQRWEFGLARVNRIRSIDVIEETYPLEADVDMSVKIDVSQRGGSLRNVRVLRRLLLRFEKQDDGWFVTDYRHMPIAGGPDQYSPVAPLAPNQRSPAQRSPSQLSPTP